MGVTAADGLLDADGPLPAEPRRAMKEERDSAGRAGLSLGLPASRAPAAAVRPPPPVMGEAALATLAPRGGVRGGLVLAAVTVAPPAR